MGKNSVSKMSSQTCSPVNGSIKSENEACNQCWKGARDLCRLNAVLIGFVNLSKAVRGKERGESFLEEGNV